MNKELISKLFQEATFDEKRVDISGVYHPYIPLQILKIEEPTDKENFINGITTAQYYKFAEMIINTCIYVADSNYDCGKFPVGCKIAEHFGINL